MRNRKKNEQKVKSNKNPWNTNKHTNIHIIEIPEKREKRKRKKKKKGKIIAENATIDGGHGSSDLRNSINSK